MSSLDGKHLGKVVDFAMPRKVRSALSCVDTSLTQDRGYQV